MKEFLKGVVNMDELLTIREIAVMLKKSPKTVYHYVETGVIPPSLIIRVGNAIRMWASDLKKFIESHRGV